MLVDVMVRCGMFDECDAAQRGWSVFERPKAISGARKTLGGVWLLWCGRHSWFLPVRDLYCGVRVCDGATRTRRVSGEGSQRRTENTRGCVGRGDVLVMVSRGLRHVHNPGLFLHHVAE